MPVGGSVQEPDPRTVEAARRGDIAAFEEIVRAFQADVWRFVFHLARDESLADDVTQDAFIKAFRNIGRYRGDSRFSTWLLAIARNCAMDEFRRSGRRRKLEDEMERQPRPSEHDQTRSYDIREALKTLSLDVREPLVMIDLFGLSYRDVSDLLGVPVGTVKSRVHRARLLLAEMFLPESQGDAGEL